MLNNKNNTQLEIKNGEINYKLLASKILNSIAGDTITIETQKNNYSNIKRGLKSRKLLCGVHYSLRFDKKDDKPLFIITILN